MKFNAINFLNLLLIIMLIIPESLHMKRAIKKRKLRKIKIPGWISMMELISKLICMFLMVVPIIVGEFRFESANRFIVYLAGNILILLLYFYIWYLYFQRERLWSGMGIAILPVVLYLNTAFSLNYFILAAIAFIFGFSHIFIAVIKELDNKKANLH